MRRPLIAGNWKMNMDLASSKQLAGEIAAAEFGDADVLVCPPYVYLDAVSRAVAGSGVSVGAQDVYFENNGAFTGEISTSMLTDVGCQFVILGHSERRHVIGETDQMINRKLAAVLAAGLTPIVCVGEMLEEREAGQTLEVVQRQFDGSLAGIDAAAMKRTVVAYEPVWAIGTGKTATPDQAQAVHADLRKLIADRYNSDVAQSVRILYGGSVKPDNAADLMSREDIDGALVGGASLKADSFIGIIRAAQTSATN